MSPRTRPPRDPVPPSGDFGWGWVWLTLGAGLAVGSAITVALWGRGVSAHAAAFDAGWKSAAAVLTILATFIAVRRLRLSERQHRDEVHDAAERRITELYTKAVDQLGAEKSAVRLGGLYALERLAQGNPEHRQTIIEVICAYLRTPTMKESPDESVAQDHEEREVRLAAQRILVRHTRHTPSEEPFWPGVRIDLTGATLIDADFSGCDIAFARFAGTIFRGDASFKDARLHGTTAFDNAKFYGAVSFSRTTFDKQAGFDNAEFHGKAGFVQTQFIDYARFNGTVFHDRTDFCPEFSRGASFEGATFKADAGFYDMSSKSGIDFDSASFSRDVAFRRWTADYYAHFKSTEFHGSAYFEDMVFKGDEVLFDRAVFEGNAVFAEVRFDTKTDFCWTKFEGNVLFNRVSFQDRANFGGAVFQESAGFESVEIFDGAYFEGTVFHGDLSLEGIAVSNLRSTWRPASVWPDGYQAVPYEKNPDMGRLEKVAGS